MATNIALTSATQIKTIYIGGQTTDPTKPYDPSKDTFFQLDYILHIDTLTVNEVYTITAAVPQNMYLCYIQLIGDANNQPDVVNDPVVLAYQEIQPSIEVLQSDSSEFSINLVVNINSEEKTEIRVFLDYLNHSLQEFNNVHDINYSSELLNNTDYLYRDQLESRLIAKANITGTPSYDVIENKIVAFEDSSNKNTGTNCSFDSLGIYYWQTDNIIDCLNSYKNTVNNKESITGLINNLVSVLPNAKPFLGFNNEYGSFLYWYWFYDDYIAIIYAGCNTYNNVDIVICKTYYDDVNYFWNTSDFFNEENHQFRCKLNRIFNTFYMVAYNLVFYIDIPASTHLLYKNYSLNIDNNTSLNYKIRITDFNGLELQKWDSMKVFPIEYSDLENKLIFLDNSTNEFIYNLDNSPSFLQYFNASTEFKQPNDSSKITTSYNQLYETTIEQIKYLLKNSYNPIYLSSCVAIGYSYTYQNYMILPKLPVIDSGDDYHVNIVVNQLSYEHFQELLGIDNFVTICYNEWDSPNIKLKSLIPYMTYNLDSTAQIETVIRDRGVTVQQCTPNFTGAKPYYYHQIKLITGA